MHLITSLFLAQMTLSSCFPWWARYRKGFRQPQVPDMSKQNPGTSETAISVNSDSTLALPSEQTLSSDEEDFSQNIYSNYSSVDQLLEEDSALKARREDFEEFLPWCQDEAAKKAHFEKIFKFDGPDEMEEEREKLLGKKERLEKQKSEQTQLETQMTSAKLNLKDMLEEKLEKERAKWNVLGIQELSIEHLENSFEEMKREEDETRSQWSATIEAFNEANLKNEIQMKHLNGRMNYNRELLEFKKLEEKTKKDIKLLGF